MAEISFRAEVGTGFEHTAHILLLDEEIFRGGLFDGASTQADVNGSPPSDKGSVIAQEEGKTGKLHGNREVGVNNVAGKDAGIPVAEHARRNVDGHHRGTRLIDVARHCLIAAVERIAQAGAEKAVDDKMVRRKGGDMGSVDNLGHGNIAHAQKLVATFAAVAREGIALHVDEYHMRIEPCLNEQFGHNKASAPLFPAPAKTIVGFDGLQRLSISLTTPSATR